MYIYIYTHIKGVGLEVDRYYTIGGSLGPRVTKRLAPSSEEAPFAIPHLEEPAA